MKKKPRKSKPTKPAPKKGRKRRTRPKVDLGSDDNVLRCLRDEALSPSTARTRSGNWRPVFLHALGVSCNVTVACRAAGIDRGTAYDHKKSDKKFADLWDQALDTAAELMEEELHRRAFIGFDRPVYQGGFLAGKVREYSDTLGIFLLKAHRPEKYRERISVKNDTPRQPVTPASAVAAIARFLGEVEPAAPAGGAGAGGEGAGPR